MYCVFCKRSKKPFPYPFFLPEALILWKNAFLKREHRNIACRKIYVLVQNGKLPTIYIAVAKRKKIKRTNVRLPLCIHAPWAYWAYFICEIIWIKAYQVRPSCAPLQGPFSQEGNWSDLLIYTISPMFASILWHEVCNGDFPAFCMLSNVVQSK